MRYYHKATYIRLPWGRGTLTGTNDQFRSSAGARPLFSNPLDDEVYDAEEDERLPDQIAPPGVMPTDKSVGGFDA